MKEGAAAIAQWRGQNPSAILDLTNADLTMLVLDSANLQGANLAGANLLGAILERVDLIGANLSEAKLQTTRLDGTNLHGANLAGTILWEAGLVECDFTNTNAAAASFVRCFVASTHFRNANLTASRLTLSQFVACGFDDAILRQANLASAVFAITTFDRADLSDAIVGATIFARISLARATGLATVRHRLFSSVGIDTLLETFWQAGNQLTSDQQAFFRGAGIPNELLILLPRIAAEERFLSAFIAYGQPDLAFSQRLYGDLRSKGIPCWLYDMDATVGEPTWREIGQQRRSADKVIVVCSSESLVRDGVLKEIEEQIDEDPQKLMPISLDDLWKQPGFRVIRGTRDLKPYLLDKNYADFTNSYEEALNRLLAALRRPGT